MPSDRYSQPLFPPDLVCQISVAFGMQSWLRITFPTAEVPVNHKKTWYFPDSKGTVSFMYENLCFSQAEQWRCKPKGLGSGGSLRLACIPAWAQAALWGPSKKWPQGCYQLWIIKNTLDTRPVGNGSSQQIHFMLNDSKKNKCFHQKLSWQSFVKTAPVASCPGLGKCHGRVGEGTET